MLFANIDLLDENLDHRSGQWVGVRDGRIAYLGAEPPAGEEAAAYGEVYDGRGRLLMPAFFNAHSHAPMTLLRGYAENLPLQAWLNDAVFPFEAKITPEDCYWAALLACARDGALRLRGLLGHVLPHGPGGPRGARRGAEAQPVRLASGVQR